MQQKSDAIIRIWRSSITRFTLLGMTLFLLGLEVYGLRLFGHGIDAAKFGDLATWAQSIGTVAAVAVALRQIQQERRARITEIERAETKERTRLYCWIGFREEDPIGWYLYFNNLTATPIGSWVLRIFDEGIEQPVCTLDVSIAQPIDPSLSRRRLNFAPGELRKPRCELDFADADGRCWSRTSSGRLDRIAQVRVGGQVLARDPVGEHVMRMS